MLNIRKGGHRDLERYYSLMELDFDKRELLPKLAIHKAMSRGDQELLIVYDEESQITQAYALVFCRGIYGYVLLKYFGVTPWFRGKGIGLETMRMLNRRYADRQGILAELTVFEDEDGETLRRLRKFFHRFGYVPVPCGYRLGGSEAELLVKPLKGSEEIGPVAHRMIRDFYSRCLRPSALDRMVEIGPLEAEQA